MEIQIAVCGAGTMGSGIAQLCAQQNFAVRLFDVDEAALGLAQTRIQKSLQHLVTRGKISSEDAKKAFDKILFTSSLEECTAFVIIEAIVEQLGPKVTLFQQLAQFNNEEVVFVSNTSSLSISEMQRQIPFPERVAGMHFFNPPVVMPLVELVKGESTQHQTIDALKTICEKLGKEAVVCEDSPGFIVNRVARPYYLEALRLLEAGVASQQEIDTILEATGFRMGPFKLMDLIGLDVNLATSESVYAALDQPERLKPSRLQIEKVMAGELGRKTGKGFYQY